jgi:hypothetical protein
LSRKTTDSEAKVFVTGKTHQKDKMSNKSEHKSTGKSPGGSSGYKSHGRQVLGKTEELGENVYKIGTSDQADRYIRTTEAIADYVGVEYGWDMRMLVKNREEAVFTEPVSPGTAAATTTPTTGVSTRSQAEAEVAVQAVSSEAAMAKYKAQLAGYLRDERQYKDDKAKVFVVILGQCTVAVTSWLENSKGFKELELKRDVKGLLAKLEEMAFSAGGVHDPYVTLMESLKRFASLQQGPKEGVAKYHKRFTTSASVLCGHWGDFFPSKLISDEVDKEKAYDKLLARAFLMGADKVRFGSLVEDLNNSYLGGIDKYPESLDATLTFLSNYQDKAKGLTKSGDGTDNEMGMSFAQRQGKHMSKVQCHACKQYGHYANKCPNLKSLTQSVDDGDGGGGKETTKSKESADSKRGSRGRSSSAQRVAWSTSM